MLFCLVDRSFPADWFQHQNIQLRHRSSIAVHRCHYLQTALRYDIIS